jgi:hypothetical protein
MLFLLEDSSSSDDSDMEELLDDGLEQTTGILAATAVTDVRKGSTMGRLCIPQPHIGHVLLFHRGTDISVPSFSPPVPNASIFVQQDRRNV